MKVYLLFSYVFILSLLEVIFKLHASYQRSVDGEGLIQECRQNRYITCFGLNRYNTSRNCIKVGDCSALSVIRVNQFDYFNFNLEINLFYFNPIYKTLNRLVFTINYYNTLFKYECSSRVNENTFITLKQKQNDYSENINIKYFLNAFHCRWTINMNSSNWPSLSDGTYLDLVNTRLLTFKLDQDNCSKSFSFKELPIYKLRFYKQNCQSEYIYCFDFRRDDYIFLKLEQNENDHSKLDLFYFTSKTVEEFNVIFTDSHSYYEIDCNETYCHDIVHFVTESGYNTTIIEPPLLIVKQWDKSKRLRMHRKYLQVPIKLTFNSVQFDFSKYLYSFKVVWATNQINSIKSGTAKFKLHSDVIPITVMQDKFTTSIISSSASNSMSKLNQTKCFCEPNGSNFKIKSSSSVIIFILLITCLYTFNQCIILRSPLKLTF